MNASHVDLLNHDKIEARMIFALNTGVVLIDFCRPPVEECLQKGKQRVKELSSFSGKVTKNRQSLGKLNVHLAEMSWPCKERTA